MVDEGSENNSQGNGHKKYTIPRKKRLLSEDCQQEAILESRETKDLLNSIDHLTWEAGELDHNFTILKVYKVENPVFEREFQTKRSQMKDEGKSSKEMTECLAFKAEYFNMKAKEYCKQGLCCQGNNSVLGDPKMGVSLWRCPDLCLKTMTLMISSWTVFLVVFRVIKGRVKPVSIQQGNEGPFMEPTPNCDCHISKNMPNQNVTDITELMNRTQYYLYEYNEEGLTVNRPRQCLPYAVIHIKKTICNTPLLPEIKHLSLIDEEATVIEPIKNTTPVLPEDTKVQHYIGEGQGTMVWRGLITTRNHSLCVVSMLAGHKISLNIWKSFLDVSSKIPLDNLLKIIPGDIQTAWNKPLIYRGYTLSLCTLKPSGPSDNYMNFIKTLSLREHAAGLVNVDSSTVLFLLPSSKLAIELGFCEKQEPWRMFCIVRRRIAMLSPNIPVISNAQAVQPKQINPETLNINVKVEVPNNARIPNTTSRPARFPVTSYSRSKSLDYLNNTGTAQTKLARRTSHTGLTGLSVTQTPLLALSKRYGPQNVSQENEIERGSRSEDNKDPTNPEIPPDSSVHIDVHKAQQSAEHCSVLELNEGCTSSTDEDNAFGVNVQSTSSAILSNLFHVMRSKAIPFLEETQHEGVAPEQYSSSNDSGQENQISEPEIKVVESNCSFTNDIAVSPTDGLQRNFDDSTRGTTMSGDSSSAGRSSSNAIRCLSAYQKHKQKLIPCTRKTSFTKMKPKDESIIQPTSPCTSEAAVESHVDKLPRLDSQEDMDKAPLISPNFSELSCSIKNAKPLKRRPSLSERIREIKKLCLKRDGLESLDSDSDESKIASPSGDGGTTMFPSAHGKDSCEDDGSSSPMEIDQASMRDSIETKSDRDSNMDWANGLEVVEAMLLEVEFVQIDEETEAFVKESAIEHFEVDATRNIYCCQENIVRCVHEQSSNSGNHVNISYPQVTGTRAPASGLIVDDPPCPTERGAEGDTVLRKSHEAVEPLECSTPVVEVMASRSCMKVDRTLSKSIPCPTERGAEGDTVLRKSHEAVEPLECSTLVVEVMASRSCMKVDRTLSKSIPCPTERGAEGDTVLRKSHEAVEPLECSTPVVEPMASRSCMKVDQTLSKSTPCPTERGAEGDTVLRKSHEAVEPLECSTAVVEPMASRSCMKVDRTLSKSTPCPTKKGAEGDMSCNETTERDEPIECSAEESKLEELKLHKQEVVNNSAISTSSQPSPRQIDVTPVSRTQMATPNNETSISDERENQSSTTLSNYSIEQSSQTTNKSSLIRNHSIPYFYKGSSCHRQHPPPQKIRRLVDDIPRTHPGNLGYTPLPISGPPLMDNNHNGLLTPPYPLRFRPQQMPLHLERYRIPYPGHHMRYRNNYPLLQRPVPVYRCYGDVREGVL